MTRAWLWPALALAACAGPKSVGTSWVMQPAGAGACTAAETANGSCFLIDDWQEMMVPPVVVGPGRILVVTRAGLRRDRARAPAADPFVIEEITRAGEQRVADGSCPGRHPTLSQVVGLVRLPSGDIGLACLEDGKLEGCVPEEPVCDDWEGREVPDELAPCSRGRSCNAGFVHFGVVDRARGAIVWRWRKQIEFGLQAQDVHVAAVGDRVAALYRGINPPHLGWNVVFGPDDAPRVRRSGDVELADVPTAVFSAGGDLKAIFKAGGRAPTYRELTIAKDGATSVVDLDQRGRVTASELREPCLAEDGDGSLTVSLPYPEEGRGPDEMPSPARHVLTLRYPNAIAPRGPDVFPTARASCAPWIVALDADSSRASFDAVGPIIVYAIGGGPNRPRTLRVERRAR